MSGRPARPGVPTGRARLRPVPTQAPSPVRWSHERRSRPHRVRRRHCGSRGGKRGKGGRSTERHRSRRPGRRRWGPGPRTGPAVESGAPRGARRVLRAGGPRRQALRAAGQGGRTRTLLTAARQPDPAPPQRAPQSASVRELMGPRLRRPVRPGRRGARGVRVPSADQHRAMDCYRPAQLEADRQAPGPSSVRCHRRPRS
jgi:hypothetical protein